MSKRWGIKTNLEHYYPDGELPDRIVDDDTVRELIRLASQGDVVARHKLIESKMQHALAIALKFECINRDDLSGMALYVLVHAIDAYIRHGHGQDANDGCEELDKYITFAVRKGLGQELQKERLIRIPKTTAWRHKQKGTFDKLNVLTGTVNTVDSCEVDVSIERLSPAISEILTVNQKPSTDIADLVHNMIQDSPELLTILKGRIRGLTDKEIANEMNCSISYVTQRRAALLLKLQKEIES